MMMMVVVVVALSFRIWLLIGDLSSWKICFASFGAVFDLGFLEIEKRKIVVYIFILLKEKSRLN